MNLLLNYTTVAANIAGDLLEPAWIRDSPRKLKFGGGKIMVWGYIQYGGVREICRVEGNINSLKYKEILAYLHIKVPQGEEDQDASGLASPVTRHEHH
ncbi:hypothetical protein QQF64_025687 [Cirrhinus molitorella]|uniref:Uncharacterized protein n=1 Tax=Cirrhinus molitorella TaxID=172907 RepID=A0ABR3NPR0_9TELE